MAWKGLPDIMLERWANIAAIARVPWLPMLVNLCRKLLAMAAHVLRRTDDDHLYGYIRACRRIDSPQLASTNFGVTPVMDKKRRCRETAESERVQYLPSQRIQDYPTLLSHEGR